MTLYLKPFALPLAQAGALAVMLTAGHIAANPTGPIVVNGSATITTNGNLLQVTSTPSTIINWQSFSIGTGDVTRFIQQSQASAVLNRVTGAVNPSVILGALQSNAQVFIINPNGVLFGTSTQVDTTSLRVSSFQNSMNSFHAVTYSTFSGSTATFVNSPLVETTINTSSSSVKVAYLIIDGQTTTVPGNPSLALNPIARVILEKREPLY